MQAVKRVEVVTDTLGMREIIAALERAGLTAYTLVRDVAGRGERGMQAGDELTDVFSNSMLLTACPPERLNTLVNAVRPVLQRRGGMCLVSDAEWVLH